MNTKHILGIFACLLFIACNQDKSTHFSTQESTVSTEAMAPASVTDTAERVVIKTAEINLHVKNIETEIEDLQTKIQALNGHVFHYEINSNRTFQNESQQTLDSSFQFFTCNPEAMVKVKVPVEQTNEFVKYVLSKKGSIEHFMLDEEDVTEDLNEKRDLMNVNIVKGNTIKNIEGAYFDKETQEEKIVRKTAFLKMKYKTKYLWFDIRLQGNSYNEKQTIASAKVVRTPIYILLYNAFKNGFYLLTDLLVALIHIWPIILIGVVFFVFYKKQPFMFNKKRN